MSGPLRRGNAPALESGLNYAAIGATMSSEIVSFPPEGFKAAEYRHRIGSGSRRFDLAGRALMTWGALRGAGFAVDEIRAEPATPHGGSGPLFLEDGTPWITPGMTAVVTVAKPVEWTGPVKVITVFDEPGRIGYVYGSCPGHVACGERMLLLEHDADDSVWLMLRSLWQPAGTRWSPGGRATDTKMRKLDERIVRALHPSNVA
jgi:uncharacterized protein (UPF0548 family)